MHSKVIHKIDFHQVWIIVPAYNEATVIQSVLIPLIGAGYSVVVVDDCSSDQTPMQVTNLTGVHLCRHPINLGQGAALQTGIEYALSHGAKYLVTFDADGQHDYTCIPDLISPLITGDVDLCLGSRFCAGASVTDMPKQRRILLKLATFLTKITTGLAISDTHNGFRAFTASAAAQLKITQNRMAHASQILARIKEKRLRYKEIPVRIIYTDYSLSKGQHAREAINIVWDSVTESLRK
ncbi:glycosyltransferase family 2 protein [bacterium]|nr:glycosyltransferase family 2 protein [bacterium]